MIHKLRFAAVVLTVFWVCSSAWAQDGAAPGDGDDTADGQPPNTSDPDIIDDIGDVPMESPDEVIVVTGSRIRTDPLDAPAPVLQLNSEDIARSGLTSVADLLQRLPVSGGAINTKFNSSGNFGFPPDGGGIGAGSAQADLRYLGSKRVLVLVDGVRWVNGSSGSGVPSATDLNTIPIGIIERIEVLEDGASPIYGSDAIGGVINIITKKNFEGVSANAYFGGYHEGDGITQKYDVTWGQKSDRMSMVMSAYFVEQRRIAAKDRAISGFPVAGFTECAANCSSGTPQGRFSLTDPNTGEELDLTINDGVVGVPTYDPNDPTGGDFHGFTVADRFNYSQFNLLLTPSQRFGVFSGVTYKLDDNISFVARGLFNHRNSVNQAAPEPLFIGPEAGNGNRLDRISIHETNPYNPFGFTLDAETNPYFIGRRPLEAGPRIFEQSVNTFYLAAGLEGNFKTGLGNIFWDTTAAFGINRADQLKYGAFNSAKLEKALGPLDACDADPSCVPFNIFGGQGANGGGTITQEMLDYVSFVQKDVSQQELIDVTANISGDLVKLPGGKIRFAAGVEHRQQRGFFQPDAIVVAGDSAGVPSSPTDGEFRANEAYAEIRLPILSKVTGANLLDLSGAVRYSDYSTFGAESTLKTGMRWRPNKDLLLRGNYGQGFRAPGIGELFGANARFDQTLTDPCSDFLGQNTGNPANQATIDNCVTLGVPADGSYEQFNQQISVTTGGNRALKPETSDSLTLSLAYSPSYLIRNSSWVNQLDIELTYYRIELAGAIQAIDAQVQLDQCVQTLDPALCNGISRTPTGVINGYANQLTNVGSLMTSGVDFSITYLSPKWRPGQFRVTSISSLLLDFTESIPTSGGFDEIPRAGTEVGDPERAFPKFKSTFIVDWYRGDVRASLATRYIHSVTEQCRGFILSLNVCSDPNMEDETQSFNTIGATVYNDVTFTWTPSLLEDRFDLTLGVNNLTNREPPKCYTCALNGFDGTTYDVPGVFGYLRAGYRM